MSSDRATELARCPFAHIVQMDYRAPYLTNEMSEDGNWCVYCPMCSASTGSHDFPEVAVKYWNTRTPAPQENIVQIAKHILAPVMKAASLGDYAMSLNRLVDALTLQTVYRTPAPQWRDVTAIRGLGAPTPPQQEGEGKHCGFCWEGRDGDACAETCHNPECPIGSTMVGWPHPLGMEGCIGQEGEGREER